VIEKLRLFDEDSFVFSELAGGTPALPGFCLVLLFTIILLSFSVEQASRLCLSGFQILAGETPALPFFFFTRRRDACSTLFLLHSQAGRLLYQGIVCFTGVLSALPGYCLSLMYAFFNLSLFHLGRADLSPFDKYMDNNVTRNKRLRTIIGLGIGLFLLAVAGGQNWQYTLLRGLIGQYAYGHSYAMRNLGVPDQFIGQVAGVRWNALSSLPGDIPGFQPRLSIARETVAGTTETQWVCAYLVNCTNQPPNGYEPSPFPPITDVVHAIP